jgi:WD40 repeat protein/tetratricopeptide (TPR) repeat protein
VSGGDSVPSPEERIEAIAERFLGELRAGRAPDRLALSNQHPDIADRLARRLALVEVFHRAASDASAPDLNPGAPPALPGTESIPERLGRFQVLGLLGRGTFGSVYKALDPELGRAVAVKIPRVGSFASAEEEERFLREARSAAALKHPGIVQVHEVAQERGMPCIVSEYVEGRTLAEVLLERRPSCREAAALVAQVADALDHAHREKVIHRDVKPGNILIDGAGRPHVTDFGLARREEGDATVTLEGQVLGTPAYMSPEQAAGRGKVDARSDVYSLGVVLYELLTGQRPFRGDRSSVIQQVLHDEPPAPRTTDGSIPRDLETICLKAMAKEPERRYAAARELADDLLRYLNDEPIRARSMSAVERLFLWGRRNPAVAALAGTVAALLVAVALVSTVMARLAARARDQATLRLARLNVATGMRLAEDGDRFGALPWLAEALRLDRGNPAREDIDRMRFAAVLDRCPKLVRVWFHRDAVFDVQFNPDGTRLLARVGARALILDITGEGALKIEHPGGVGHAAWSPDGSRVCTAGGQQVQVRDAAGLELAFPPLGHAAWVRHASFSADGRLLATASDDRTARVWEASTGAAVGAPLLHQAAVYHAAFSPDGTRLATAVADETAVIWDLKSGESLFVLRLGATARKVAWSPDGLRLGAAAGASASIWDAATGKAVAAALAHGNEVLGVVFSPDSRRVLTASLDGTARLWDAATGEAVREPFRHVLGVPAAAFSPDGRRLLTASFDGTVQFWEVASGRRILPPLHHGSGLTTADFSRDGRRVVTGCWDRTARVYDFAGAEAAVLILSHGGAVERACFSPDGLLVATASADGAARVWRTGDGKLGLPPVRPGGAVTDVAFSSDGRRLATASAREGAGVWDTGSGACIARFETDTPVERAIFSRDGVLLATVAGKQARVWQAATGAAASPPLFHPAPILHAAFSPEGKRLATACADGGARIWDVAGGTILTGPLLHLIHEVRKAVQSVAFSDEGTRLVTAGEDECGHVWDASTGAPVVKPLRHTAVVRWAAFGGGGRLIITASMDGTARVWDAATGMPAAPRFEHGSVVLHAALSSDGRFAVTGGEDNLAWLWDVESGLKLGPALEHADDVRHTAFSPDGLRVLTASRDGTARIWILPTALDRPFADLDGLARMLSQLRIEGAGSSARLESAEFREAWERLQPRYPADFAVAPEEVLAWRRREAAACEQAGIWPAALTHLEALLALDPGDWRVADRRGHAHAILGRWPEAAADFRRALEGGSERTDASCRLALAILGSGDAAAYAAACEDLITRLEREEPSASAAEQGAWACVLAPRALADPTRLIRLAERAVALAPRNFYTRKTLGAALYRAGDAEGAIRELMESRQIPHADRSADSWIFLALAQARLGNLIGAREWLSLLDTWLRKFEQPVPEMLPEPRLSWVRQLEVKLLRRELEEQLAAGPAAGEVLRRLKALVPAIGRPPPARH